MKGQTESRPGKTSGGVRSGSAASYSEEALARALNQLRKEQFFNEHGLDGGVFSGSWEAIGERFQGEWRKAARRLLEILREPSTDAPDASYNPLPGEPDEPF